MKTKLIATIFLSIFSTNCTFQKNKFGGKLLSKGWMDCDDYSLEKIPRIGKLEFQTIESKELCVIKITQHRGETFRLFLFNSEGFIKIFSSIPGTNMLENTSMQVYSVFPFKEDSLEFKVDKQEIFVQTTNGWNFSFDGDQQTITKVEGSEYTLSKDINLDPNNGLKLTNPKKDFLLINHGHMIGKDPSVDLTRTAIVSDHEGHSCQITNSDFLEEIKNEKGTVLYTKPKLSSKNFVKLLQEKCKNLNLKEF